MPSSVKTNYFVCTLGEAEVSHPQDLHNVNHLIDVQAKDHPDLPAVGFYGNATRDSSTPLKAEVLTFGQVRQGVLVCAEVLSTVLHIPAGQTIGLLCSSSPEFFFAWLACIWLGNPVLLIAPECTPSGIASLCQSCEVSKLLTDSKHAELGREAAEQSLNDFSTDLIPVLVPFDELAVFENARSDKTTQITTPEIKGTDIAYFHHTSGTSSGKPKPISQSHHGVVGAFPCLGGKNEATFTTTPMYHGGPADTFRAWTSSAMIWLFPSQHLPITAANVMRCLECSKECSRTTTAPKIRYFASVPYILQMMGASEDGLGWLTSMELVGVGGAALPKQAGDELVKKGVRLVSRFGSAECGFLLSSYRDFAEDRDWQYLRLPAQSTLRLESRDEGLAELVVPPTWPQMAKRNREDGSYATSDLFERHPSVENAWRYHSRADSQLTLVTGKKFDPAPLEAALVASTPLLSDVLVFGNDRPYPGALVFRSGAAKEMDDDELLKIINPIVDGMNKESQSHAQIPDGMLIAMPYTNEALPKSSKGTILRGKAEQMFSAQISSAYDGTGMEDGGECPDNELSGAITKLVEQFLPKSTGIERSMDLFSSGVDSVASVRIRSQLHRFLPKDAPQLPINVVEMCPTVDQLAQYIAAARSGELSTEGHKREDISKEMWKLVEEYGNFEGLSREAKNLESNHNLNGTPPKQESGVVVLTGATGALGAHVLDQLRNCPRVSHIYCLVRGADAHAAQERLSKALEQRKLPSLSPSSSKAKVTVLQATLSDPRLGLPQDAYNQLAHEMTTVMHLAWSVNFRMHLQSFAKDSIAGLHNLLKLALVSVSSSAQRSSPKFLHCSSVASAAEFNGDVVPEEIINDPAAASNLGYSQSKWVAEQICARANQQSGLAGRVGIFRVGQLSGDNQTGVWNSKEAWPLMLSSVRLTGALPDLGNEVVDWLPVDLGAEAMVQGIDAIGLTGKGDELGVFHVLNDHFTPTWKDLLAWLKKKEDFDVLSPAKWVDRLESAAKKQPDHPAMQLLNHWKTAFQARSGSDEGEKARKRFAMDRSKRALPVLDTVRPVDEAYLGKLWDWVQARMP